MKSKQHLIRLREETVLCYIYEKQSDEIQTRVHNLIV